MSSKASGEPSMMLSVSVLYALRRAVASARNSLCDAYPTAMLPTALSTSQHAQLAATTTQTGATLTADSTHEGRQSAQRDPSAVCTHHIISSSCGDEAAEDVASGSDRQACKGNSFLVLEAPVTTAHLKEAVGQFDIAEMVRVAAGRALVSNKEPEYHSSGEWVFVH